MKLGRPRKIEGALVGRVQVASLLGIHVNTLKAWLLEDRMPAGFPERVRVNQDRWMAAEVEAWLADRGGRDKLGA